MAAQLKAAAIALLTAIVAAGADGTYGDAKALKVLVDAGLVETNADAKNEAGEIAVRSTQAGVELLSANTHAANPGTLPVGSVAKAKSTFQIDDGIAIPTVSGRGRGGNTYPFDDLAVGQSFFVEATETRPTPAKSLASTVSSANARYKEGEGDTAVQHRKFIVRSVECGARVWRQS